jgi:cytoskeletal protein CcmA (bactofilin family)
MIELRHTIYDIRYTDRGAALLVVLFVIMAITILSLGFMSRSDVELACGENMILRTQMDYLAESGLEHAKGLVLDPQDVASEYWTGAAAQQLAAGSDDYYEVAVVRDDSDPTDYCNYIIDCNSYRMKAGQEVGRCSLSGDLRLDPCIALWTGSATIIWSGVRINGDLYCNGTLENRGAINGDVFAGALTGTRTIGGRHKATTDLSLVWPRITVADFTSRYSTVVISSSSLSGVTFGPYAPPRVCYRIGDLSLGGDVQINGTLIVSGDLTVQGGGNIITAGKNMPALLVTGELTIKNAAALQINGLAVVYGRTLLGAGGANLTVLGGLFTDDGLAETAADSSSSANVGVLYNGATWQSIGGRTGGALQFDGVDDYVQTPNSLTKLQVANDYTLSVWVKPASSQKDWAGIISKCSPSGSTNHWTLQFNSGSSKRLIVYHPDYLPSPKSWDTGISLSELAGAWHHVGIVRSGAVMTSYLDGIPRTTGVWLNSPGFGDGHLNIGADRTPTPGYVYGGLLDDVRIYNRALNVNEVYPPVAGLPGLIAHWKFDESGSNAAITAAPTKTAIITWSEQGAVQKWGQAAGAFFRSIRRD